MATHRNPILLREQATPGTPPTGWAYVYMGTDHRFYNKVDSGEVFRTDNTLCAPFSQAGVLAVVTGVFEYGIPFNAVIEAVVARLGTINSGSTILDVNKNGTTIFTTQSGRPTFSTSKTATVGTINVTSVSAGDYLTVDVDAIGATPGSNLTVCVYYRRTG